MTTIEIDHAREYARFDWGQGVYTLVCHRYEGARPVYEYRTPTGAVVRVGGFRQGIRALWDRMMRECD